MNAAPVVAIVGAGPAGLRAAEQIVRAGLKPVLIDESPRVGGQIYRQPPPALRRPGPSLYGSEAGKAAALFACFAALRERIDHRPETLVWQIEPGRLYLASGALDAQMQAASLAFDALILATGATDRVLPFAGWTLPGVFTLGAAQIAWKAQAALIGPRVVFAGSGPLLFLVASQYVKAGADVLAVLDSAAPDARRRALPQLLARPRVAARGAGLLLQLRRAGVAVHRGARLIRAEGGDRVQALHWRAEGQEHRLDCDAVAFGHGLRSETQLADLAGCAFAWDATDQAWLPQRDTSGRSSVPGVYLAGDGATTLGADAAELTGARAALACLEDLGRPVDRAHAASLERTLVRHRRFRSGIEQLGPPPADWAADADDALVVCRCEEVTAGEIRRCVRDTGTREMNRLKALTRAGMGRCQGRMCAAATARLLAHSAGCALHEVGRLRSQPPVKPLPIRVLAAAGDDDAALDAVPAEERDD